MKDMFQPLCSWMLLLSLWGLSKSVFGSSRIIVHDGYQKNVARSSDLSQTSTTNTFSKKIDSTTESVYLEKPVGTIAEFTKIQGGKVNGNVNKKPFKGSTKCCLKNPDDDIEGFVKRFDIESDKENIMDEIVEDLKKVEDPSFGLGVGSRGILANTLRIFQTIKNLVIRTVKIGNFIIKVPLQGVVQTLNVALKARRLGLALRNRIIRDARSWFKGNWDAVKTMEFPRKNLLVLLYRRGLMSVVDKITERITYISDGKRSPISYTFAYTLYLGLEIIFLAVTRVMKARNLDCIKLNTIHLDVNRTLIRTIDSTGGKVCGISHLRPVNNVTITSNDKQFLRVSVPWALNDISVRLKGVTVESAYLGKVLENEDMDTQIKSIKASGMVTFKAGLLLRFQNLNITIHELENFNVEFPSTKKSGYMQLIEGMSENLASVVKKEINLALAKLEKKVFKYIAKK